MQKRKFPWSWFRRSPAVSWLGDLRKYPVSEGSRSLDTVRVIAQIGRREVGFLLASNLGNGVVRIGDLTVCPKFQRQGLGELILREFLGKALTQGYRVIGNVTCGDLEQRPWLGEWYERLGFQRVEPHPGAPRGTVFGIEMRSAGSRNPEER